MIDSRLKEFATPRDLQILEAIESEGSERQAAKALGISRSTVQSAVRRVQQRAVLRGYSPEHHWTQPVPEGHLAKGVSTYFDADGNPRGQWVKSSIDRERMAEILREGYEAMAQSLPRLRPARAPTKTAEALCNVYTITDAHVGMLAWHKEGGADWDLKIAERSLTEAFHHMVEAAPSASTGLIAQLGDFLHSDGMLPVTPTSGHVLDQDGRFSKIVAAALRILRRMVDHALTRHERVIVLMAEGNHDLASSIWLRAMFRALYEHEPRVSVIDSELPYYVHQHGSTMLAFHHGHLKKNAQLPLLFAAQYHEVWGATKRRYCHTGHWHHVDEKEHSGMTVIQHPTLAARDAYAARGGWLSERAAVAITYHEQFGQVARNIVVPEMFAAA